MTTSVAQIATAAAFTFACALSAQAATVDFGATPTAAMANPTADATTGTVYENVVGSIGGLRRSPWQDCACGVDENALDSFYTSVSGGATATYAFSGLQNAISFLWGSPDNYNDLDIILTGGGGTVTINGTEAQGPVAIEQQYVTISDVGLFDTVTFRSTSNAFEFANLETSAVPIPAALPMLAFAIAGMGFAARRRRGDA